MARQAKDSLIFAPEAIEHLDQIESKGCDRRSMWQPGGARGGSGGRASRRAGTWKGLGRSLALPADRRRRDPTLIGGHTQSKYLGLLERSIREQLTYTPGQETRNRKPLEPPAPFSAAWEIRCGPGNRFRVFYDVDLEAREVRVLAIGIKDRNRLFIGGEEYDA